jgi:hypothetical protein
LLVADSSQALEPLGGQEQFLARGFVMGRIREHPAFRRQIPQVLGPRWHEGFSPQLKNGRPYGATRFHVTTEHL